MRWICRFEFVNLSKICEFIYVLKLLIPIIKPLLEAQILVLFQGSKRKKNETKTEKIWRKAVFPIDVSVSL